MDEGIAEAGLAALENSDEAVLAVLNAAVCDIEREFVRCYQTPQYPTVFVVGLPRSGTTLLTQLLIQHVGLGYVDNIAAKFWEAPYVGLRISRNLWQKSTVKLDFESTYGVTHTPFGPHEFGRFGSDGLNIAIAILSKATNCFSSTMIISSVNLQRSKAYLKDLLYTRTHVAVACRSGT